jgi:hypothetical protein
MLGFSQSLFLVIITVNSDYSEWSKLSGNENCGLEEWGRGAWRVRCRLSGRICGIAFK